MKKISNTFADSCKMLLIGVIGLAIFSACTSGPKQSLDSRDPASFGGPEYNEGSYHCADQSGELKGKFTFGASEASLKIKGVDISLNCVRLRDADVSTRKFLVKNFVNPTDVCSGSYSKGNLIATTSNSMGIVQMNVFLLSQDQTLKNRADLNCNEKAPQNDSGW